MDDRAEASTGRILVFIATLTIAIGGVASLIDPLTTLGARGGAQGREAGAEAATLLDVLAVHGARNSTASGIWDLRLTLALPAGGEPVDLASARVTYVGEGGPRAYSHSAAPLADSAAASSAFNATWLVGSGASTFVMHPGDIVQVHVNLVSGVLAERSASAITIDPLVGAPVTASLATPSTYGADLVVPLV